MSIYEYKIKRKRIHISILSLILTILIFFNLMLQENAFALNMRGIWIYVVDVLIFLVVFLNFLRKRKSINIKELKESIRFLTPFVVMIFYSIIINLFTDMLPVSEILTTGLYWIIPVLVGIIIYLDLKETGIDIIYNAILINYFMVIMKCISVNGILYLFKLSTYTNNFGSLLEVHPIGLALPLFLIYYLFEYYQYKLNLKWSFWIGVLFTLMCGKRIAIIGFVLVVSVYCILRNISKRFEKSRLYIFMGIVFISSFVYLIFVKYNGIQYIAKILGINTMSRSETWDVLKDFYTISPLFLGNGIGFSTYYLKNLEGVYINGILNKVGDVHNDILKSYIDVGFVVFIFYMWFIFISNLRFFLKKKCKQTALLYFLLMFYTLFLMFVDNIMRYDLYLLLLFLIPMVNGYREEKIAKREINKHNNTGL